MSVARARGDVRPAGAADGGDEDARLIAAARGGDRRSFRELYLRHLDAVYARVTRLVGPIAERDDLVQQVFIDVHAALARFRGEASFATFVQRIAINVAYEHLRRRRRNAGRDLPLDDDELDRLVALDASPEARAAQRGELARVFAHLDALKPKLRVAFVLVAVEGLSLADAAALVGAERDTVKQRVLHARRTLAERLARLDRVERSRASPAERAGGDT
jgi:RNA polymerase sigma-70 factor (ECF subfamily)